MNLGNIKKINIEDILRYFLAAVFLSAGIFRIFNPEMAEQEMLSLALPPAFSYFLIFLEIGSGLLLLLNKWVKIVYWVLIVFLIGALEMALAIDAKGILNAASELFVFNLTPTDFFLHSIFLLIIILLIFRKKNNQS